MIGSTKWLAVFFRNILQTSWLKMIAILMTSFMMSAGFAQNSNSIKSILNPDGSIVASATQGSFDVRGYTMVTGQNGAPRFIKTTSDPNDKNWDPSFTVAGIGGQGYAVANSGDTLLYVGGIFGSAGNIVANNIAVYNLTTNTWSALDTTSADKGVGVSNSAVESIIINGSDVYIGGSFSDAGGVAANNVVDYNTTTKTWTTLGSGASNGVDAPIYAMAYFGSNLYVGGRFANAGGSPAKNIARWDGASWHALGSGVDSVVLALAVGGGYLYAGGQFTHAGGDTARYIAKWDGSSWSRVGTTKTDITGFEVAAILPAGNLLYVGGNFGTAGGTTANNIAEWNGTSWSAVGAGASGTIYDLTFFGGKLYVFGRFTTAGLLTVNNIAAVDTSSNTWSALGTGTNVGTNGLNVHPHETVAEGKLFLTGGFSMAGGTSAFGIASWNGTTCSSLGGSPNAPAGTILALALSGSNIYVGGSFLTAGSIQANNIAVYNTNSHTWSSLGTGTANGVVGGVNAIAVLGSDVYAAGGFTSAGGNPANNIAMWDGTEWNTLGTSPNDGVNNGVYALGTFGTDLYVGGGFTSAGGSSANYVAKWSGTAWSSLGSGINNYVYAIAAGKNEIYFGGFFSTAGSSSANCIASWNGSGWSALGTPTNGVNNTVLALATYGDTVFVGGDFTTAGGNSASHLAKWDTHQWTPLGAGVNNNVYALAINGTNLFVGGLFTASGLNSSNRIIEWSITDSSFSTLGDGLNSTAEAILSTGNDTYVGGEFTTAGNKPSYCFARYNTNIALIPTTPVLISPLNGTTGVARRTTFSWNASTNATSYHLQVASSNAIDSVGGFVSANVIFDTTLAVTTEKLSTPLTATTVYYWHISATGTAGTSAYSAATLFTTGVGIDAVDNPGGIPKQFALYQNYPNPFNPSTTIRFDLKEPSVVALSIYDVLGQKVVEETCGKMSAGSYEKSVNMEGLSSGVYLYRIDITGNDGERFTAGKKLLLLK